MKTITILSSILATLAFSTAATAEDCGNSDINIVHSLHHPLPASEADAYFEACDRLRDKLESIKAGDAPGCKAGPVKSALQLCRANSNAFRESFPSSKQSSALLASGAARSEKHHNKNAGCSCIRRKTECWARKLSLLKTNAWNFSAAQA
jgi:hypothetical protein